MDKKTFIALLAGYGLSSDGVSESLSYFDKMIWHNGSNGLKIVASRGDAAPIVELVFKFPRDEYRFYKTPLKDVQPDTLHALTHAFIREHGKLREQPGTTLTIALEAGQDLRFQRSQ